MPASRNAGCLRSRISPTRPARDGGARTVAADMERIVASEPGRERAWALLMRALYASGRQHDALDRVSASTGHARRAVRPRAWPRTPAVGAAGRQSGSLADPTHPGPLPTPLRHETTLVGRANELPGSGPPLPQARTGVGQVRSVLGPIGSGRTRLVAEMAATVVDEGGAVEYIAGASGLHLLTDGVGLVRSSTPSPARCRTNPLMVVIDDVEWTPPASVDAIRALAAAAERLNLFFVLVGQDIDGPVIRLIHDLERSCSSTLYLAPMSDHDVADILAHEGIDSEAIDAAVAMADGLPGMARQRPRRGPSAPRPTASTPPQRYQLARVQQRLVPAHRCSMKSCG